MSSRFLLILALLFISVSCSQFRTGRSYLSEMESDDSRFFNPNADFPVVGGDSGRYWITERERSMRTPASAEEREEDMFETSLRHELRSLESSLGDSEVGIYEKYKSNLKTISEKIYFLKLSDFERREYLISRDLLPVKTVEPTLSITGTPGIRRGMTKGEVVTNLGNPTRVDVAGNPQNENERWLYNANGAQKFVYFEAGTVFGWE